VKDKKTTNLSFFTHQKMCFFVGGSMKKNFLRVVLSVLIGVSLYFVATELTRPKVIEGEKEVTIIISINTQDQKEEIFRKTWRTDAELLSELLTEGVEKEFFTVIFGGQKTDPFGRFLVGFNDYVTQDMTLGPWWVYDSTTNSECLLGGYCPGVDFTPVYDQDVFEFELIDSF